MPYAVPPTPGAGLDVFALVWLLVTLPGDQYVLSPDPPHLTYGFSEDFTPSGRNWPSGSWSLGPPSATVSAVERPPSLAVPPTPGAGLDVDMLIVDVKCVWCRQGKCMDVLSVYVPRTMTLQAELLGRVIRPTLEELTVVTAWLGSYRTRPALIKPSRPGDGSCVAAPRGVVRGSNL